MRVYERKGEPTDEASITLSLIHAHSHTSYTHILTSIRAFSHMTYVHSWEASLQLIDRTPCRGEDKWLVELKGREVPEESPAFQVLLLLLLLYIYIY